MPQSRHRKIVRAKKRPRGITESRAAVAGGATANNQNNIKTLAMVVVAALVLAAVAYFVYFRGRSQGSEVTLPSGLKYVDTVEGTGATPQKGQTLSVHYKGTLESGKQFDSSYDRGQPMQFRLGLDPMIKGWDEGVSTMKVGGKRKLIVPPKLGYGPQGRPPDIPPNATLIFELELVAIK